MVRQDIYGLMRDDVLNETRYTSSRRGKVKEITFICENDLNTPRFYVNVYTSGVLPKQNEDEALEKIKEFNKKGNTKKAKQWADKFVERNKFNNEQSSKEFLEYNIDISLAEPKVKLDINGTQITPEIMELIRYLESKDWDKVIKHISKTFNNNINIVSQLVAEKV
jgi:hypothetical protein